MSLAIIGPYVPSLLLFVRKYVPCYNWSVCPLFAIIMGYVPSYIPIILNPFLRLKHLLKPLMAVLILLVIIYRIPPAPPAPWLRIWD